MRQKILWNNLLVISLAFVAGNFNQWFVYSFFSDQISNLSHAVNSLEIKQKQTEVNND